MLLPRRDLLEEVEVGGGGAFAKYGDVGRRLPPLPGLGHEVGLRLRAAATTAGPASHPAKAATEVGQGSTPGVATTGCDSERNNKTCVRQRAVLLLRLVTYCEFHRLSTIAGHSAAPWVSPNLYTWTICLLLLGNM